MNHEPQRQWSAGLQQQTRDAINEILLNPMTGCLHLKSIAGKAATIRAGNLLSGILKVELPDGGHEEFADVEALLAAGWAID
jgi:hypothetical protein